MADELLPLLGVNFDDAGEDDDEDDNENDENMENEEEEEDERKKEQCKNKKEQSRNPSNFTFDLSLPVSHSYLGDDLEEIRGRTILDDDSLVTLPIIQLPGMVLVPGQTIPLHLFHQHTVAMIKGVIDNDKTFGIVAYRHSLMNDDHRMATIGTTAEIFSVRDETDDQTGFSSIRIKAKGRQRFHIVETSRSLTGILIGKVKILPEKILPDALDGVRPLSHCKFCCNPAEQDDVEKTAMGREGNILKSVSMINNRQINRFTAAYFTWWPPWVYKMYDSVEVVRKTKEALHKWNESFHPNKMPTDPVELSYWVAQNVPLDDTLRINLLSVDNAVQRLRCALSIMEKCSVLRCRDCDIHIANNSDVFSLSLEGPSGAYVNPGGYVHETMTLYKATNLKLIGLPQTEHSWFPGYAWTIAQCKRCNAHMGWKFTASKKNLSPAKFWGITRAALVPGIEHQDESGDEWMPVM